ncbi:MAG: DNA polymerase IV [SAR202 cluster bacterium]|nr:DNA polymerase IV [SAR202 cluster bacterium]
MEQPRVFHMDLDAFFVAVERAHDPSLVGKAVVVGGEANSRGVVTCASYEARPYGLRAGMPLTQAYKLCPHAIYLVGRYERYSEVSDKFLKMLGEYSPFIEPLGMDEAYMDMTGFERLYGPLVKVAREIKERVRKELKVVVSVGIGSSKITAKVASDRGKPDGLVEVLPGEDARFLAPLELEDLPGVGERTAQTLRVKLGVKTVGEVARLPETALRRTFGAWGDLLHRWANGIDHAPVQGPMAPKSIGRSTTFHKDTREVDFILATLRYLTERVGNELRKEQKKARRVSATVRFSDFETIGHQVTLKTPICHDQGLYEAAESIVLRTLKERKMMVRLVGVSVGELVEEALQGSLFRGEEERWLELSRAFDKAREKYGFPSLQTGRTFSLAEHYPEDRRGYILKTASLSR